MHDADRANNDESDRDEQEQIKQPTVAKDENYFLGPVRVVPYGVLLAHGKTVQNALMMIAKTGAAAEGVVGPDAILLAIHDVANQDLRASRAVLVFALSQPFVEDNAAVLDVIVVDPPFGPNHHKEHDDKENEAQEEEESTPEQALAAAYRATPRKTAT
jgi:hypothetical protein